jgi:hypothetical protein
MVLAWPPALLKLRPRGNMMWLRSHGGLAAQSGSCSLWSLLSACLLLALPLAAAQGGWRVAQSQLGPSILHAGGNLVSQHAIRKSLV